MAEPASPPPSDFAPSLPRVGLLRRGQRWASRIVPLMVWLGAAFGAYQLLGLKPAALPVRGMASIQRHIATPAQAGHLERLLVERLAVVERGQILGRLSGATLELQARQIGQQISALRAELQESRRALDLQLTAAAREQEADLRRFRRDVENVKLEQLRLHAELEEARVRREGLAIDLTRMESLSEQELVSEAELIRIRTEHAALGERLARGKETLAWHDARLDKARARLNEYRPVEANGRPAMEESSFRWRIAEAETALELVALQRTRLVIRAPASGVVDELFSQVGQLLEPGSALLSIVEQEPRDLVAYVPLEMARDLEPGQTAEIQLAGDPTALHRVAIQRVGPAALQLPEQLWSFARSPEWGVPVLLRAPSGLQTMPGESFQVRFEGGG